MDKNTIKFQCPQCGQKLEADQAMFGNMNHCPACRSELRVPDSRLAAGIHIGNFILKKRIGMGGMGEVWLAEQQPLGRPVALKIVKEKFNDDPSFQKRFAREIKNSGRLNHPNIATAYFAGADNNIHYMAIEYIEGKTLDSIIKSGPVSEEKALSVLTEVATGLDYAWKNFKMIHRDIKPSNIMISTNGTVKLLDMGIARSLLEGLDTTLTTTTGEVMGTPHYMSPEQAQAQKDIDCRTDIYSLGIVLHEMLAGRPPFDAPSPVEVVAQHIFAPRPDLHLTHNISSGVAAIARKMIEADPENRFRNYQDLLSAIADPSRPVAPEKSTRSFRPGKKTIAAMIVIIMLMVILLHRPLAKKNKQDQEKNTEQTEKTSQSKKTVLSQEQREKARAIMNKMHNRLENLRKNPPDLRGVQNKKLYFANEMKKIHQESVEELKKIMTKEQFEEFRKRLPVIFRENTQ